jgi:hypothetical protein
MTTGNDEKLVTYFCRRMKPSGAGARRACNDRNFSPTHGEEIIDPQIVKIADALASKHHQVGIEEFSRMVGPGPRSSLVTFRIDLDPLPGLEVEHVDGVESLSVSSPSSEEDEPIVNFIVVHGAIGAMRGDIPSGGHLVPFHRDGVETPEIVHVVRICIDEGGTCIAAEVVDLILNDGA